MKSKVKNRFQRFKAKLHVGVFLGLHVIMIKKGILMFNHLTPDVSALTHSELFKYSEKNQQFLLLCFVHVIEVWR